MDIGHIDKVANRKRLLDDIQKVGNKVSKENAELIKLQIANDTAFWEMKEKLAQKESEHEKLQQNMVTLQMQYESLSAKYQEEVRLRSEVLNEINANRRIYDVLEEEMGRVMQSISRINADKVALCEAYKKADNVVCELKQTHIQEVEKARHKIEVLERTVTMSNEHQAQLTQVYSASKQQADADLRELKNKLEAVAITKEELSSTVNDLNRKLDISKIDIEKRDDTISTLQRDMKEMINSFNGQAAEARAYLVEKDKQLKSNEDEIKLLKGALSNQETFTKEVRDQNSGLQDTLAELEENYQKVVTANDALKIKIEEMTIKSEKLQNDLELLNKRNDGLVNEVNEKSQVLSLYEGDLEKFKDQINTKNEQIQELSVRLNDIIEESRNKSEQIHSLESENEGLNKTLADTYAAFEIYRDASEDKNKKQAAIIEERNKELEAKTSHIIQVTMELQNRVEELTRLEKELQNVKREKELEMANAKERETKLSTKLAQLEATIKSKDEQLSQQMREFLEIRNEAEREKATLREKHNALQLKLDNIRKETAEESRVQPDDNAVVMTPDHGPSQQPLSPPLRGIVRRDSFEDILSFSRYCAEGDSLDSAEVSRQFNALNRGEALPPDTPAILMRRREIVPDRRYFASLTNPQPQPQPQTQPRAQQIDRTENVFTVPKQNVTKERRFFKTVKDTGKIKKRK